MSLIDDKRQSFEGLAWRYDRRDELTGGWVTSWLHAMLAGRHGANAVDLGCAGGRNALVLAEHYEQVRAVDLSHEMIQLARVKRPHPRITYEQGDLTEVRGCFDLVLSVMTLHHVPDITATLHGIADLVKPGGLAILVDGAGRPAKSRLTWHIMALRALGGALRRHDEHAWETYRLSRDAAWIDHLMSDRFLTPEAFARTYADALPGAAFTRVNGLYAAVWERPLLSSVLDLQRRDLPRA